MKLSTILTLSAGSKATKVRWKLNVQATEFAQFRKTGNFTVSIKVWSPNKGTLKFCGI